MKQIPNELKLHFKNAEHFHMIESPLLTISIKKKKVCQIEEIPRQAYPEVTHLSQCHTREGVC